MIFFTFVNTSLWFGIVKDCFYFSQNDENVGSSGCKGHPAPLSLRNRLRVIWKKGRKYYSESYRPNPTLHLRVAIVIFVPQIKTTTTWFYFICVLALSNYLNCILSLKTLQNKIVPISENPFKRKMKSALKKFCLCKGLKTDTFGIVNLMSLVANYFE